MFQILAVRARPPSKNARLYDEQRAYVRKIEESTALLQAEDGAAGRLSASIAHEVNNPLQSVQNCLHLAGREDVPEENARNIPNWPGRKTGRGLSLTVRRMLDFYSPRRGQP